MKVRLLIAAILFLPLPLRAQIPLHRILQTQYQGISQTFLKEVTFHSPTDQPGFVVYGNLRYGYYKLTDFQRSDGKIRFSFLPPGYQSPIEFYFRAKRDTRLGTRLFQNPTPRTFLPLSGRVKGRLSTPYVLMGNGVQVPTDGDDLTQTIQFQAVVILNRFGEIVWLHVPVPGNQFSVQEINAKQIGPGRYGLIQSHDHFEVVDYRGKVSHNIRFAPGETRLGLHHDFAMLDANHVLALGYEYRYIRLPHPTIPPILDKIKEAIYQRTPLLSHPRRFRVDTLQRLDLISDTISQPLWDSLSVAAPARLRETLMYRPLDGVGTVEMGHGNSIQVIPEGYLVSLSRQSRIVFLDKAFRTVWTLGSSSRDTYRLAPPQIPFQGQHGPMLLSHNELLLFDNLGDFRSSRVLKLSLGIPPNVFVHQILRPTESLRCHTRGSAYPLPNGHTLAFFPSPFTHRNAKKGLDDTLIEFAGDGSEVARMEIDNPFLSVADGFRAEPIHSLGREEPFEFLGPREPRRDNTLRLSRSE